MAGLLSFLSDISVRPPEISGPLAQLMQSQYELKNLKYPSDLGANDKGHYLVININVQKSTQFKNDINEGAAARRFDTGPGGAGATSLLKTISNAADTVKEFGASLKTAAETAITKYTGVSTDTSGTSIGAISSAVDQSLSGIIKNIGDGVRATSQISTVIYLYMPDTLNFDQNQQYDNPSLSGLASGFASMGQSVADVMTSGGSTDEKISKGVSNLTPFAAKAFLSKFGGKMGDVLFTAGTGLVQNPLMEVLYTQPRFREFRFDFMFYPRTEAESMEVQKIISELRFHQAPEGLSSSNGFFLVPPSEFNISFYYNGQENPNIPKLGICVLKQMNINYAPSGFSAYEIPGQSATLGGTGMPVAIQLSLSFMETEIKTKSSFNEEDKMNGLPHRSSSIELRTPTEVQASNDLKDAW
jgi:hypothetical protein